MNPVSFVKPIRLERSPHYLRLPKRTLWETERLWLLGLLGERRRSRNLRSQLEVDAWAGTPSTFSSIPSMTTGLAVNLRGSIQRNSVGFSLFFYYSFFIIIALIFFGCAKI